MRIAPGWHSYAVSAANSPYVVTKLELELPEGAEAVGGWQLPAAHPYAAEPGTMIYEGEVVFLQAVRLGAVLADSPSLHATVSFQACDAYSCLPPDRARVGAEVVTVRNVVARLAG